MSNPAGHKRFKINPIELIIFAAVTVVFFNSAYQLFYDWNGFHPSILTQKEIESSDRQPAQITGAKTFEHFDVNCSLDHALATQAARVRLSGSFCGVQNPHKIEITNTRNQANATVFVNSNNKSYSTDYISVEVGANPIQVKYVSLNGQIENQIITVEKK